MAEVDTKFKIDYAFQTVSFIIFVSLLAGFITTNAQLALGILIPYQLWNFFWVKILIQSPNIYSVKVPTMILQDWVQLSIPSTDGIKIRKDKVVTSISELSGIRGAHMMVALRVMTATLNMIVLVAIQQDLHHRNTYLFNIQSSEDMIPISMLVMTIGFFLTGHFELNLMDKTHALGHYLGVSCIFLGSTCVGFVLKWNTMSMILIALEFVVCALWITYCEKIGKKSQDIKEVTRRSKICIGIELGIFFITNVILTISIYAGGKNSGNLWVSPFLEG